tara:strand:+ start:38784 stop:39614 length:831 start_codon:yes stop_codon:yes gene_type:complete
MFGKPGRIKKYDKLVLGSGIDAVIYAAQNNLPLIQNDLNPPYFFEKGCDVWGPMVLSLSIMGNLPFGDKVESVRVVENGLKINTKDYGFYDVGYNKLIVFDDENVEGLGQPTERLRDKDKRMVLDWVDVKSGMVHDYDEIATDSDFIKKIYFYRSKRIDGNHDKKDLVCVSYLNKEELDMVEYSNSYLRLKMLQIMKEYRIRGEKNGFTKTEPRKQKYRAAKIEHAKREVIKIKRNRYKNTENIEFLSQNTHNSAYKQENGILFSDAHLSKVWGII